jgi:hypothetical protein
MKEERGSNAFFLFDDDKEQASWCYTNPSADADPKGEASEGFGQPNGEAPTKIYEKDSGFE